MQGSTTYPPLTSYRVTYDDGTTELKSMAAGVTLEEARRHFIGQRFEITETTFRTALTVEPIRVGVHFHRNLSVAVLNAEAHARTCNYWYCVYESAMSHTAFATEAGLMRWMSERGLRLAGPLTPAGTPSYQPIIGEYGTTSYLYDVPLFDAIKPLIESRTLSNGDYVVAKITEENGVRVVHTLNPNFRDRKVFDYRESDSMMR